MRLGRMLSVGEVVEQTPVEEPVAETPAVELTGPVVQPSPARVDEPVAADR